MIGLGITLVIRHIGLTEPIIKLSIQDDGRRLSLSGVKEIKISQPARNIASRKLLSDFFFTGLNVLFMLNSRLPALMDKDHSDQCKYCKTRDCPTNCINWRFIETNLHRVFPLWSIKQQQAFIGIDIDRLPIHQYKHPFVVCYRHEQGLGFIQLVSEAVA